MTPAAPTPRWLRTTHHPPGWTWPEILRHRAQASPDSVLFTHLVDGETAEVHLTAAALWERARSVATHLTDLGLRSERALVAIPQGVDYAVALFGCLLAGVIAVPVPAPEPARLGDVGPRLAAVARDATPAIVITTFAHLADRDRMPDEVRRPPWIAVDRITAPGRDPAPVSPHDVAYLAYTSGSTAASKGVMVTHRNLVANCGDLVDAYDLRPDSVMVTWAPSYHGLGLVYGVVMPVFIGFRCVSFAPAQFFERPVRWLQAVSRYRGTHTVAPNFGFDLVIARSGPEDLAGLDLSSWQHALNGAEPIRSSTERRFVAALTPHGLGGDVVSHSYGMSEAVAKLAAERPGDRMRFARLRPADLEQHRAVEAGPHEPAIEVASCGVPAGDTRIVAVDPDTFAALPDDRVGELWVSGTTVAPGYWRNPEATRHTFEARLDSGDGPFLRTGDLGFLRDGRVYLTGRLKDLIILRGENHYPQDVEFAATQAHAALIADGAAAFSVDGDDGERLIVVLDADPARATDPALLPAVRAAIGRLGIQAHAVVLVPPGTVPKTTTGKIQRGRARQRYLAGDLPLLAAWTAGERRADDDDRDLAAAIAQADPRAAVLAALRESAAARIGVRAEDLDPDRPLQEIGLDSVTSVEVLQAVGRRAGVTLEAAALFDHPTLGALADLVVRRVSGVAPAPRRATTAAPGAQVAIVGLACRLPGDVASPEALWELLVSGRDPIGTAPADRWPGVTDTPTDGGFLADIRGFDAARFGIAPAEATALDPQQRLLLELTWQALEDAGFAPDGLGGSRTGVYVGVGFQDYGQATLWGAATPGTYAGTGVMPSIAAGRIAYTFGFRGPVLHVDAACASFLLGVHLASQALRAGECDLAVVGAANLLVSPQPGRYFARLEVLSATGRCRTFSADADGYVRSEGGGVVVLQRLDDAVADRRRAHAVIRGEGVTHGGRGIGLTAPTMAPQADAMSAALARAGLSASDVQFVEAHGTASPLGDLVECTALHGVYGDAHVALGAAKSHVGNLEAASGVPALFEAALAVAHGRVPPLLHLTRVHPDLAAIAPAFVFPRQPTPWPVTAGPRRAGVNSYGINGTNVHLVLEQGPPVPASGGAGPHTLVLSAATRADLRALAGATARALDGCPLAHAARTLAEGRARLAERLALVADDVDTARAGLDAFARSGQAPELPATPEGERARRWVAGEDVAWPVDPGAHLVSLPTTPFDRSPYWVEAPPVGAAAPTAGRATEADVLAAIRDVLGVDAATTIDPDAPLGALGLDSLRAVALRNRLHELTGTALPLPVFMDAPTARRIAASATAQRAVADVPAGSPAPPPTFGTHAAAIVAGAVLAAGAIALWQLYTGA